MTTKRKGTRGRPELGQSRLITKAEFALLRHLGAKRTHYIGCGEMLTGAGFIEILYKSKDSANDRLKKALCSTPEAIAILKDYWGIE